MRAQGHDPSHGGKAADRRGTTQRRQRELNLAWEATEVPEMSEAEFRARVLPALLAVPTRRIAETIEVTRAYAKTVQTGKRLPHPRHWVTLRDLAATAQSDRERRV
jgi:hypothetical protein